MARTKSAGAARPAPGSAPAAAPAGDSPDAAVRAALAANPGATTAAIATAAGTAPAAARGILARLADGGEATRAKGSGRGAATWTLTTDSPAATPPPDPPGTPEPGEQDPPAATATADGGPAPAGGDPVPGTAGPETEPAPGTAGDDEPEPGPPGDGPDPALLASVTASLDQIEAAVTAGRAVLAGSGDLHSLRNALDEIYEQAGGARRDVKAAAGGVKSPAARPGALRDKVLAFLQASPDQEFTPHDIHRRLHHSSGAIANALVTLAGRGEAELTCPKPVRYRLAPGAAPDASQQAGTRAGPATAGTAPAGPELAGAAA